MSEKTSDLAEKPLISVIMPYWERQKLLQGGISMYRELYASKFHYEIVVVDDGSSDEAYSDDPNVRIIRLPHKTVAKNSSVPMNLGASLARGEILVLTNPEMRHRGDVLTPMLKELAPNIYVAAACWGMDTKRWHVHSEHKAPSQAEHPENAGLHFCAMLYKDLFDRAGGFDEQYRDGAGYDDSDFLWRLYEAGAGFKILDNCIVDHPKTHTKWTNVNDNKKIFLRRWKHRLSS